MNLRFTRAPAFAALAGLAFVAAVSLLPERTQGRQAGKALPADLALAPGDCMIFATLRPGDLDPALKSLALGFGGLVDERLIRVPLDDIERVSFCFQSMGEVVIVRTTKPYDHAKLRGTLRATFGFGGAGTKKAVIDDKGKVEEEKKKCGQDDKKRENDPIVVKKVGNYTIELAGGDTPFTDAICRIDEKVFVAGPAGALKAMLKEKAKRSEDFNKALAKSGEHMLVVYFEGARLKAGFNRDFRGEDVPKAIEIAPPPPPPIPNPKKCGEDEKKAHDEAPKDKAAPEREMQFPPELLPFKPLLTARSGTLTADVKPKWKADLTLAFPPGTDLDDAETSLKTTLYVIREAVGYLSELGDAKITDGLVKPFQTTLRKTKITRGKDELQASVALDVNEKVLKGLMEAIEQRMRFITIQNNFKQIALAMHNYHDATGEFPGTNAKNMLGQPGGLSWRVAILPYIEQDNLYRQFNLNEAWDSETNKKLLSKMPKIYAPVGVKTAKPDTTFLQVCTGPSTPFRKGAPGLRLVGFTDGTSNTLLVVEAGQAVPWTKPADIAIEDKKALPKFGAQSKGVFHAAFADGSVRTLKRDLDEATLRALISPSGGEVIDFRKLEGR